MVSVKFYLKNRRAETKTTIRTSITRKGERFVFCPGYSISPIDWDHSRGLPKSRASKEGRRIGDKLLELELDIRRTYEDLLDVDPNPPMEVLKRSILQNLKGEEDKIYTPEPIKLVSFFEEFITECETGKRLTPDGTRLEENSIKPFRTALSHLQNFERANEKSIPLDMFNQEYHDDFLEYLEVELEISRNSSSKYIMCLLQVLKYAVKKKLFTPLLLGQIEFATSRENSDNIYLNEKELKEIMNLKEFNSPIEEVVRDLFIVGCYTGLRFSNYSNLKNENIHNGIIDVVQVKTGEKVQIPIHPFVDRILRKYKNKLPKAPTNQEFNRTLKDICSRIPELDVEFSKRIVKGRRKTVQNKKKWMMVMTHSARRSFCTNMYQLGVPVPTIMTFSGHRTEKNFYRYIKSSVEDHSEIIKEFWNRGLKN